MYAVRYSPNITGDVERDWSAWMGMRFDSFLGVVNGAGEISEYDYAEWAETHDMDTEDEETAEAYLQHLGWDVRVDPATGEYCVVHHDGLSVFVVGDEGSIEDAREFAKHWHDERTGAVGFGSRIIGAVKLVESYGDWHVLEVANTTPEN